MKKAKKIVIGLDQSYTATGIGIAVDGILFKCTSTEYKGLETRSEKRREIARILNTILTKNAEKADEIVVICERVRTFSKSFGSKKAGGNEQGSNPKYLMMTGALVATIVDTAALHGIDVYSVDTRAWKSKVVGNSKARTDKKGNRDAKSETIEFIEKLGFDMFMREKKTGKNKGERIYNDNAADGGCIALYGFIDKKLQNLKLEE